MKNIIKIIFIVGWVAYGSYELMIKREKEIKLSRFEFLCLWLLALVVLLS
jgi:hypothetical protein